MEPFTDTANAKTGRTAPIISRQAIAPVPIEVCSLINSIDFWLLKLVSAGHGYSVELSHDLNEITIGRGATRGLAVHPVGMSLFSAEAVSQC